MGKGGTGHDLLKFLDLERVAGRLDSMTVSTYKTACRNVLALLPEGLDTLIDAVELDVAQQVFEGSPDARRLAPATRSTYMSSFKAAVRAFRTANAGRSGGHSDAAPEAPFVLYAFPLRRTREAQLELPRNLTAQEADRLCGFVRSLVIDTH